MKSSKVSIKTRSTPASLTFKDQATKHTTVKWSIIELVEEKKSCSFGLPNSDPHIHTDIRAKLSV